MLRKQKNIYIALFRQYDQMECAKIGISNDPEQRLNQLNKFTMKKIKPYCLYATFSVNNDKISREIEKIVYNKFPKIVGREYLDVHPERVFNLCKRELKKRGISFDVIWKNEEWMNQKTAKIQ